MATESHEVDFEEDLLGGDAGQDEASVDEEEIPDTIGPELKAILAGLSQKADAAAAEARSARERVEEGNQEIARLREALARSEAAREGRGSGIPFVPLAPDNDYYEPGRANLIEPQRPRLLPLRGERVWQSLAGTDPDRPSGRALEWATVVSVATYLGDFAAYWGSSVAPLLTSTPEGSEVSTRCENTLRGIFEIVEGRYDFIFASCKL